MKHSSGLSHLSRFGLVAGANPILTLGENEWYAIFGVFFAEVVESVDTPS
jgi:hypothetical protein